MKFRGRLRSYPRLATIFSEFAAVSLTNSKNQQTENQTYSFQQMEVTLRTRTIPVTSAKFRLKTNKGIVCLFLLFLDFSKWTLHTRTIPPPRPPRLPTFRVAGAESRGSAAVAAARPCARCGDGRLPPPSPCLRHEPTSPRRARRARRARGAVVSRLSRRKRNTHVVGLGVSGCSLFLVSKGLCSAVEGSFVFWFQRNPKGEHTVLGVPFKKDAHAHVCSLTDSMCLYSSSMPSGTKLPSNAQISKSWFTFLEWHW